MKKFGPENVAKEVPESSRLSMTNREKLNAMTDEEFAEWLCQQVWDDYGRDPLLSAMRFNHIRNFLKMEVEYE